MTQKAKIFSVTILFVVTFLQLSNAIHPDTRCSLADSPCLTKQTQKKLKEFVNGNPKLGIQPLDKVPLDPIIVAADNFFFNWTDVKAGGLKNAIIDNVSINMDLKTMRVLFHTDIILEFYSVLDGVLLSVLPVNGSGRGDLTLKTMQMEILFVFDIIKDENGKDVMDLKTYYYGYDTADGVISRLENLYNGDKKKSDLLHNLVNESWRIMVSNFGAFFQRKITSKIFDAVKIFMRSRPLEELALY
ncbi:uncharacterized protein LOC123869076 [Maniola jurtina]|uniref:uncharacterized protein LOC123869076 n=1 Tax=Maniola jurtina TaxID=191418 RepID=UPI001E68EEFA|nr:uncharacterized protein LOC123869076 [Maniola jurtina]